MLALLLLFLPFLCLATPIPEDPDVPDTEKLYYIRSQGSNIPSHNDLYVSAYHTGAGLNDAVLQPSRDDAARGFLEHGTQQFKFGGEYPWGMVMQDATPYPEWNQVEINVLGGTEGFWINKRNRLLWNGGTEYDGWIACNWVHGVPQLFWANRSVTGIPESCSRLQLVVEYI